MLSTDMNDWSLLREYVERCSETAFETLVRRHLDMVYSAAWRQTGDATLAEEVVQAVFVILARKASRLREGVVIAGWLYHTACLTARRALRSDCSLGGGSAGWFGQAKTFFRELKCGRLSVGKARTDAV